MAAMPIVLQRTAAHAHDGAADLGGDGGSSAVEQDQGRDQRPSGGQHYRRRLPCDAGYAAGAHGAELHQFGAAARPARGPEAAGRGAGSRAHSIGLAGPIVGETAGLEAHMGFQGHHGSSLTQHVVFTGFHRWSRPMRHLWKKPFHIKYLGDFRERYYYARVSMLR